jgi:hypothetical protein
MRHKIKPGVPVSRYNDSFTGMRLASQLAQVILGLSDGYLHKRLFHYSNVNKQTVEV